MAARRWSDMPDMIVPANLKERTEQMQFAPAVRAGDMVFCSGVIAALQEGEAASDEAYFRGADEAFTEIDMILREAGGSMADVVDITGYHVDFEKHMGPMFQAKAKWMPGPFFSCYTLIGISSLFNPLGFVELKARAYIPA
ncbi:MAG: Rid family hydrolase [Pseudomonadota bacterium]